MLLLEVTLGGDAIHPRPVEGREPANEFMGFDPQGLRPNKIPVRWDATSSVLKLCDQGVVSDADAFREFSLRETASFPQCTEPVSCVLTQFLLWLGRCLPEMSVHHSVPYSMTIELVARSLLFQ